jgi:hypothetical protein
MLKKAKINDAETPVSENARSLRGRPSSSDVQATVRQAIRNRLHILSSRLPRESDFSPLCHTWALASERDPSS